MDFAVLLGPRFMIPAGSAGGWGWVQYFFFLFGGGRVVGWWWLEEKKLDVLFG